MLLIYLIILVLGYCDGYKLLLVFPVPGKSHSILGEGYVRHLLEAGHEVTYLTPIPMTNTNKNFRQIDVSENMRVLQKADFFDINKILKKKFETQSQELISDMMLDLMNVTLHLDVVQKFMSNPDEIFDAVIVEWLYNEIGSGFAAAFNCPLIWSGSMVPDTSIISLIDNHLDPSYNLHHMSRRYSLSFIDRALSLWKSWKIRYYKWRIHKQENNIFKEVYGPAILKKGRSIPEFDEVRWNGSMILGNSHPCIGDIVALPPNYKNIGGYHLKSELEPLTPELQAIMDNAKHGVIYFSMGTMLKSSGIPDDIIEKLLEMFSELKQIIIWKFEEKLLNLPDNVVVVKWAAQQSILAHPNCVLFLTHAGLLSVIEAVNYGIPIIGMPFYGDQFMNIDRAVMRGFGKRLDLGENTHWILKNAIEQMLTYNSSYVRRAKELSMIYRNRIIPPGKELVYWIEYVVKTGGARHLRSVALQLEWYKKSYLDLFVVIAAAAVITVLLLKYILISKFNVKAKVE